jgi:hypothetical protein
MSGLTFEGIQWRAIKLSLVLASALIASMGLGGTPQTEAHATGLQHPAQLVTMSNNAWSDDFQDASGLSVLEDVQVSEGQLRLASDTYLGSATSVPISPTAEVRSVVGTPGSHRHCAPLNSLEGGRVGWCGRRPIDAQRAQRWEFGRY